MEPNLILNISLLLFLFLLLFFFFLFFRIKFSSFLLLLLLLLLNAKSLVSDEAAIRSTELPRCIFITKENTERIISNVSWR